MVCEGVKLHIASTAELNQWMVDHRLCNLYIYVYICVSARLRMHAYARRPLNDGTEMKRKSTIRYLVAIMFYTLSDSKRGLLGNKYRNIYISK